VVRTERRAAVVAESLCGTATGDAHLILQPSSLDNSADKIVHTRLGARSSTRNDELTLDLTRRIESQADLTATQQAFEDQVQGTFNVPYELWRAAELVMAALGVSGHALILAHSGLLLLSPLRPPLSLSGTDSGDCGGRQRSLSSGAGDTPFAFSVRPASALNCRNPCATCR
jgi:hypothetical protein